MNKKDREIYDWFNRLRTGNLTNFINKHCGKLLDKGLYRDVYDLKRDKDYVVKIQREMSLGDFSNALEWTIWTRNEEWNEFSKYLAPSIAIDDTGQILIQKKVEFKTIEHYPANMPSMFTDFKIQNYGWIGNQIVCVDYASLLIGYTMRMKKVEWWDINAK